MKNKEYWLERMIEEINNKYNHSVEATDRELARLYAKLARGLKADIQELYFDLDKPEEEILMNDLYKNNNYYRLLNKVNLNLQELGLKEIKIIDLKLLNMYEWTHSKASNSLGFQVDLTDARRVVDTIWCADGKRFSDRIWTNKAILINKLEEGLTSCVSRGLPKDKVVTELVNTVGVGRRSSERIVRTELSHIQNEAAADAYKEAGCEGYEYLCQTGNEVEDDCDELDGEFFTWDEKQEGVNFPPLHPNCRCTILPVVR